MRFDLLFSSLALASSASAAATCKVQTPGVDITEDGVLNANCCAPLTVIFARGTIEFGNVGTYAGPPFFKVLRSQLGNAGVTIQGVAYAASLPVG
jgi:cutinase